MRPCRAMRWSSYGLAPLRPTRPRTRYEKRVSSSLDITVIHSIQPMNHSKGAPLMYDAIVVGARCAGAPTAMLLARSGRRVLLLDRAARGSDTLSTHYIHQSGVAKLAGWG